MTLDAYRELRRFLFVRLMLGGGLLIVVGAFAFTWMPGATSDGSMRSVPTPPPSAAEKPVIPAPVGTIPGGRPAVGSAGLDAPPQALLDKPRLEEVMRPLALPEPLEGKTFEILPRVTGSDAAPTAQREPEENAEVPAKLPKGPHLQAGIFAQPANAEEFRRRLIADGYPAYLETRVHVGPYPNRKEAERVREKLKAEGTTTVYVPQ